jgi:2-phosphosulfolactate phosphatase
MERARRRTVVIDCFPESLPRYGAGFAVVAVDVFRATTTAVTAAALGRRCFPAGTLEHALELAERLDDALLAGELGGSMPYGFELNNSPAALASRRDVDRPLVLLSTSGTRTITEADRADVVYAACLRNYRAQAHALAGQASAVAVVGAGARGEFREEDQLCCAWIAEHLLELGFEPADAETSRLVERWSGEPVDAITHGKSADYLQTTGQVDDLDFVLRHVDDLEDAFVYRNGELVAAGTARAGRAAAL